MVVSFSGAQLLLIINLMSKSNVGSLFKNTKETICKFQYMIGVDKEIQIDGIIPVYTDGSCLNNGKPNAISGIGVYFPTQNNL